MRQFFALDEGRSDTSAALRGLPARRPAGGRPARERLSRHPFGGRKAVRAGADPPVGRARARGRSPRPSRSSRRVCRSSRTTASSAVRSSAILSGVPYMAWYETAGWTLDRVLAMARAAKAPVTTEYAPAARRAHDRRDGGGDALPRSRPDCRTARCGRASSRSRTTPRCASPDSDFRPAILPALRRAARVARDRARTSRPKRATESGRTRTPTCTRSASCCSSF